MEHDLDRFFNALRSRAQLTIVEYLARGPIAARQRELREALGLDPVSASRHIGRLLDQGIVVREGSTQAPYCLASPDHTRWLLRLAVEARAAGRGGTTPAEQEFLLALDKAALARGAEEQRLGRPRLTRIVAVA